MKLKIIVVGILCAGFLAACSDQMNYKEFTQYEKGDVDQSFGRVSAIVTKIYTYLDHDFAKYDGSMLASATDEAEYTYTNNKIYNFINGGLSPVAAMDEQWKNSYKAIQQANLFLNEFQGLTFPENVLDDDYSTNMNQYKHFPYEARALRAYFYFNLVRQYGDVPVFTELMTTDEVNTLTRKPAKEVLQFIISECDDIMEKVPVKWSDIDASLSDVNNAGRVNRMFVLALKARVALYAASPLFNPSNEQELWRTAVAANQAVLNAAEENGYKLMTSYADIWSEKNYQKANNASEVIFAVRLADSNTYEKYNFPAGIEGGKGGNCPTQTLVDAYEMQATGKLWNEEGSGYNPATPYTGRDPRFALTIAINGEQKWPDYNSTNLETYYGGQNGEPVAGATTTGYYLKKLLNRSVTLQSGKENKKLHNWVTFRVGEFYLNYAEAAFKYTGSADMLPSNGKLTARQAINIVRARVTMPELAIGLSADDFWKKYTNERMVELAFESHRFWDVRRWKEADKHFKSIVQMKITKNSDGTFTYTRKTVNRQWNDKLYFFPIPQSERMKNPNLTQNTGY